MKIRITKELPKALNVRPTVGEIYEAEYKMTPPPTPRMAYFIRIGPNHAMVCVFPDECEVVDL
ncbi:MAG: hypothetical protein IJK52_11255 [Oscillospiraceae bacterium]|nr:hypothetical protein [Oscillospiraceae bacterium]